MVRIHVVESPKGTLTESPAEGFHSADLFIPLAGELRLYLLPFSLVLTLYWVFFRYFYGFSEKISVKRLLSGFWG